MFKKYILYLLSPIVVTKFVFAQIDFNPDTTSQKLKPSGKEDIRTSIKTIVVKHYAEKTSNSNNAVILDTLKNQKDDLSEESVSQIGEQNFFESPKPVIALEYLQDFYNPLVVRFEALIDKEITTDNKQMVRWDFETDGVWDTELSFVTTVFHTYSPFEKQTVRLEVTNSLNKSNTIERTIDNQFVNMVLIPAGSFVMGSSEHEIDERPQHNVYLSDFWIDKYSVTNQQYATFLNHQRDKHVEKFIALKNPDVKIRLIDSTYVVDQHYENHPVIHVTWYGAHAYAAYYNKSLPTEAEWEKAARGTDERLYPWGNEVNGLYANFWESGDPFDNFTTPVGFFNGSNYNGFQTLDSASPYGVYDLVDNTREWCYDWYQRNYYSNSPLQNPIGPASGSKRVVRGGGYLFHSETLRTTFRSAFEPSTTNSYVGFRCVIRK